MKKLVWTVLAAALALAGSGLTEKPLRAQSCSISFCDDWVCYCDCIAQGYSRAYCLRTCC